MIKGVIFDVDGVLLNSMPVWENLGELYLNSLGLEAEKDLGEILFAMSLEEGAEYLITQYGIDKSVEEVVSGLNREVRDFYAEKVPLKEGVRQYLSGDTNGDRYIGRQKEYRGGSQKTESAFLFSGNLHLFRDRDRQRSAGYLFCRGAPA